TTAPWPYWFPPASPPPLARPDSGRATTGASGSGTPRWLPTPIALQPVFPAVNRPRSDPDGRQPGPDARLRQARCDSAENAAPCPAGQNNQDAQPSDSKGLTATAAGLLVRVAEFETFIQSFAHEVQLGSAQVRQALR